VLSSLLPGAGSRPAAAFFCALSALLIAGVAAAHGGGTPQLSGVTAGPYWLTVWTNPEPVRAGELHVTVGVGGADGAPVLDAEVQVEISALPNGGVSLSGAATSAQSTNKFLYEVDFELPESGLYLVSVKVSGAEGHGAASFELQALPAEASNWLVLVSVGVAVLAVLLRLRSRANVSR
jgi:hypothetical protein|tara:strand:- start:42 stop:578 length:537 start_codon:yes stop_codon:yes gene_type:complete